MRPGTPLIPPGMVAREPRYQQVITRSEDNDWAKETAQPVWHLDGIAWDEAPAPLARHHCWAQTVIFQLRTHQVVYRCPCGGTGRPGQGWTNYSVPRVVHEAAPAPRRRWWRFW